MTHTQYECSKQMAIKYEKKNVVRGHHIYKSIWTPAIGKWTLAHMCHTQAFIRDLHLLALQPNLPPACKWDWCLFKSGFYSRIYGTFWANWYSGPIQNCVCTTEILQLRLDLFKTLGKKILNRKQRGSKIYLNEAQLLMTVILKPLYLYTCHWFFSVCYVWFPVSSLLMIANWQEPMTGVQV